MEVEESPSCNVQLLLTADVTEHVRVDVQTNIGHVVKVLASNQPDDLADLALGIMAEQTSKSVRGNLFGLCQLCHIVQRCTFFIGKKRARAILLQRIEFGLIHGRFDRERPANIHAEKTDVDARHLFAYEQGSLGRKRRPFVQLGDLCIEKAERRVNRALCTFNGVSTLPNCR